MWYMFRNTLKAILKIYKYDIAVQLDWMSWVGWGSGGVGVGWIQYEDAILPE